MWAKISDNAMVNLDNITEVVCQPQNKKDCGLYGCITFFNERGVEMDTALYKTKKGYEAAVNEIQGYITMDLTEKKK